MTTNNVCLFVCMCGRSNARTDFNEILYPCSFGKRYRWSSLMDKTVSTVLKCSYFKYLKKNVYWKGLLLLKINRKLAKKQHNLFWYFKVIFYILILQNSVVYRLLIQLLFLFILVDKIYTELVRYSIRYKLFLFQIHYCRLIKEESSDAYLVKSLLYVYTSILSVRLVISILNKYGFQVM